MPHNIYLAMFSPASVNVLAFDPNHGADQARGYAGKYCSKPERYFFMESEKNGVKFWLRARTVGLCATFNRLLGYHVVRNTKPVISLSPSFVRDTEYSAARSQAHLARYPLFPDPLFHLGLLGKYYFRSQSLLHLRIEQFNRYLHLDTRDAELTGASCVGHDEVDDAEDTRFVETDHRHFDAFMEGEPPGKTYRARGSGVPSAKRRMHARLGVTRTWNMEPIGKTREVFYEQRLVQGLAWFADSAPELVVTGGKQAVRWVLKWAQPASLTKYGIDSIALQISSNGSSFSYEERCHHYENVFSSSALKLVCRCCEGELGHGACDACLYAVGWHVCRASGISDHRWKRTTLFGGPGCALVVLCLFLCPTIPLSLHGPPCSVCTPLCPSASYDQDNSTCSGVSLIYTAGFSRSTSSDQRHRHSEITSHAASVIHESCGRPVGRVSSNKKARIPDVALSTRKNKGFRKVVDFRHESLRAPLYIRERYKSEGNLRF